MNQAVPTTRTEELAEESAILPRRIAGLPIAWWVNLSAGLGLGLAYSTMTGAFFGQFIPSWSEAFSLGRGEIALALTVMSVTVVFAAPMSGLLVDRFGPSVILPVSHVLMGATFAALAWIDGSTTRLYALSFLLAIVGSGTLPATYTRILLTWFDRLRGTAFGFTLAGFGVSAAIMPPVIQLVIADFGWRAAVLLTGGLMGLLGGVNAWILGSMRVHSPREIDAETGGTTRSLDEPPPMNPSDVGLRALLGYPAIYLLALAFFLLGLVTMGVTVNLPTLLIDRGLPAVQMGLVMSVFGGTFLVARPLVGFLLDRIPSQNVVIGMAAIGVAGLIGLMLGSTPGLFALIAITLAIGFGAEHDVQAFLISRIFPKSGYARVYALIYSFYAVGVAAGPPLLAFSYDHFSTYSLALACFAVMFLFAGTLLIAVARHADQLREMTSKG